MANTNVAFGLKPINTFGSSPATQGTNAYFIASDASAIFQGSLVKAELTGGTIQITSATGTREVNLKTGSYFFSEGIAWHEAVNVGDTTVSYLMVEPE